jgi:N-acetylmuramoyl-L-alanine amidase
VLRPGLSGRAGLTVIGLAAAGLAACGAAGSAPHAVADVPRPKIIRDLIPFEATRRAQTAAYAKRHYGINTWRLRSPHVIVEHYTGSNSFQSAYSTFASNSPDPELGERPGVCAHFVVDRDGTIHQLVRLDTMCRHTVGLNWTAFGIEHVGTSDGEILSNRAQLSASRALTLWLMSTYHIELRNVIGHAESLSSPFHHERYRSWRCQTHGDWQHSDMQIYRRGLARLARPYGLPLGPAARPVTPHCP